MKTIDELIQEGEDFISKITYVDTPSVPGVIIMRAYSVYTVPNMAEYENWKATAKRFIGVNYPNDESLKNFEEISSKPLDKHNHSKLLAILKAIKEFPQPNISPKGNSKESSDITITANVSQIQNVNLSFIENIKDQLTGIQLKEITEIIEQHKNTPEVAKPKIMEKLKSFGSDLLSNILATVITNPSIYNNF